MTMIFIASETVTGSAAQIQFSNIPQTFTHLQVRVFSRSSASVADSAQGMQFNGDGAGNYARAWHYLRGNGSTASSGDGGGSGYPTLYNSIHPGASTTSTIWGVAITDILDYTNTNKNKVVRTVGGYDANGSGWVLLSSGLWLSTAAINSVRINDATNPYRLAIGSRIDLYGITTSSVTGA